jgi:hypothetical protein
MASFAKLDSNNIVLKVVSIVNEVLKDSNGEEQEQLGIQFLRTLYNEPNAIWKQTSYNTHGGIHDNNGTPLRKNHAGIGYIYDEDRNAFIPKKPYQSWVLNEDTCLWESPVVYPETYALNLTYINGTPKRDPYIWNEQTLSWDLVEDTI